VIKFLIKSNKIYIRNFRTNDINKEYISWFSGKNESLIFSRHYKKKYTKYDLINYFKKMNLLGNLFIGIFDLKNNDIIGTISIYFNWNKKEGNLGILIGNKNYFSKGIGSEACKMIINYLIKKKIVKSIVAGTKIENKKMINLMKNLKMKKTPNKNPLIVKYKKDNLI